MVSIIDPFDKLHNPGNKVRLTEKDLEKRNKFYHSIYTTLEMISNKESLE